MLTRFPNNMLRPQIIIFQLFFIIRYTEKQNKFRMKLNYDTQNRWNNKIVWNAVTIYARILFSRV